LLTLRVSLLVSEMVLPTLPVVHLTLRVVLLALPVTLLTLGIALLVSESAEILIAGRLAWS